MSFETLCGRIAESTFEEDTRPTCVYRGAFTLIIRGVEHV
jgi:hypothetical protein